MNTTIQTTIQSRLPMPVGIQELDAGKWRVLCESVFPSAKTAEAIMMALDYCRARNLDIFKKPVNIVPMYSKSAKGMVETIWPGINEVQVTASRTGKYAGMDEPKWGIDKTRTFKGTIKGYDDDGVWQDNKAVEITLTYPEFCTVTVYRMVEGQKCAFAEPVFWEEAYAHQGKTEVPNGMWSKRPRGQILKVAKAFSLRAAFPEEGEYVAEEMEGKEIDTGGVIINQQPINKPSIFKNASLRNTFCKNAIASFEAAIGIDELNEIFKLNIPKMQEMRDSGNEHDAMGAEEIHKRYQQALIRLKKPDSKEEDTTFDEEEIPPFFEGEFKDGGRMGIEY